MYTCDDDDGTAFDGEIADGDRYRTGSTVGEGEGAGAGVRGELAAPVISPLTSWRDLRNNSHKYNKYNNSRSSNRNMNNFDDDGDIECMNNMSAVEEILKNYRPDVSR